MLSQTNARSKRVLVAEDDAVTRRLVTCIIESEGYRVVTVNDGGEAVRLLKTDSNFSAAVLDMKMPHIEGLEVIKFMRTEKRLMRIPVLMITSENDLKLMASSFAAGVTLFLPKPFTPNQFKSTLRLLLSAATPLAQPA
jgi:CheY-like chemotaxis protein